VVETEGFTAVLKLSRVETKHPINTVFIALKPYYITITSSFSNNPATLL